MLEICIQTSYDQNVQLILKSYLPVVYGTPLNGTFNNISVISWRSVLLAEETGVPEEIHRPIASHWQTLSHNDVISSTPRHERGSN